MEIPFISWFDKPIKDSVASVFDGVNVAAESLDLLGKYQKGHFERIKSSLGTIKILGMQSPMPLTQVYYTTNVSTTIHSRLYHEDWRELSNNRRYREKLKNRTTFRGDTFVNKKKRVVLLGGPGAGKTTFLKHIAIAHVDKDVFARTRLTQTLFPVYLSLPLLASEGESIEDAIIRVIATTDDEYVRAYVSRLVNKGKLLLLLDSLDEVPKSERKRIIENINDYVYRNPKVSMVITCRTADYEEVFQNFDEVEVTHLSKTATEKIIRGWFRGDRTKAEKLIWELKSNDDISQLTENPLLLSLLCIQYDQDLKLPARKVELYKRCIDALLIRWDTSRNFRRDTVFSQLTDDRKEKLFEYIAGVFFDRQTKYIFHEDEVEMKIADYCQRFQIDRVQAKKVLREIESHHGILEKYSVDSYCFSHPSFQEYFVARRCLAINKEMDALKKHYDDDNWSSVIEFVVAIKEEPEKLIRFLQEKSEIGAIRQYPAMTRRIRHLWLLYKCLAAGPSLAPHYLQSAIGHIFREQAEIFRVFKEGGVFPMAKLLPSGGVTHAYYYYNKRQTLSDALQQYRIISNEILANPNNEYAEMVIREAPKIDVSESPIEMTALLLCLIIPIASQRPGEVKVMLSSALDRVGDSYSFLRDILMENFSIIEKMMSA